MRMFGKKVFKFNIKDDYHNTVQVKNQKFKTLQQGYQIFIDEKEDCSDTPSPNDQTRRRYRATGLTEKLLFFGEHHF